MEAAAKRQREAQEQWKGFNEILQKSGDTAIDFIEKLGDRTANFRAMLQDVIKSFERMALQAALMGQGPLASLFGTASAVPGGTGGLLGLLSGLFGGKRAGGGDVTSGKAYLIGERGPEIMVPKSAGAVIPNHRIAMGSGARNQTVNNHVANVTVNANGGNQSQNQDLAERVGRSVKQSMQAMVGEEFQRQLRNGGILSKVQR